MLKLAVPDLVSNSYFPAEAAVELGFFRRKGLDVSLELIFPVDRAYQALRSGTIDIVAGSSHSALAAFSDFEGVKLLCAQAQGMYWFLVMHADFGAKRGDLSVVKGKLIGAAPWVEMGLRRVLVESGLDLEADGIMITPVPAPPEKTVNFGLNAAKALEERKIDGFWANGMAAEIATRRGVGTVVIDTRRGDGPSKSFHFTMSSIATRSSLAAEQPEIARGIVEAIVETHAALRVDVGLARKVGEVLFPSSEAELITDLISRDLPFYDASISRESVAGMSDFAKTLGLIDRDLRYEDVVCPELVDSWQK